jgi:hypothetical protein
MMQVPTEAGPDELRQALAAADVVASEKLRPYLPGRLLPLLIARFRDHVAEALGMDLPPLPRRPPVRAATLSQLTSSEFVVLSGAVSELLDRFAPCMDDPELPRQLASFREELVAERAERVQIAEELAAKATAS